MCASRFIEWDQKKDSAPGAPPVAMMVSSTRVRSVFGAEHFKKIVPPVLDVGVRTRSRGAGVAVLEGAGDTEYVLHSETDSESRDRCIAAGSVLGCGCGPADSGTDGA